MQKKGGKSYLFCCLALLCMVLSMPTYAGPAATISFNIFTAGAYACTKFPGIACPLPVISTNLRAKNKFSDPTIDLYQSKSFESIVISGVETVGSLSLTAEVSKSRIDASFSRSSIMSLERSFALHANNNLVTNFFLSIVLRPCQVPNALRICL